MKRSALKEFIKGEILATLTEASAEDVNNQKDLNKELEKTAAISKELGLEENGKKDHWADYTDIGMFYMEKHGNIYQGKEQKLTDSQYEKLGKKIVDQLYGGDVGKAYDETYKAVKGNELKYKGSLDENEDEEKTEKDAVAQAKAARGKHKKLDIAVKALKDITTEMKSIAREYSKADGVEKEKIKDQLKTKTAKKKELESLVAKLEKNVV
jgi:hypothetical protein|tara:strand:+ start:144 stop:776 length:633 start_codon:yes stop_codon:yes gene_type:complete